MLLGLCKETLFSYLKKIVCYLKPKIIAFFICYLKPKIIAIYKVCDVNSIPANLRNSDNLPKFPGFYQISLDKSIQSSICYCLKHYDAKMAS